MMEFESDGGRNGRVWLPSACNTPSDLLPGYEPFISAQGIHYRVPWSDGVWKIYRWSDPDPLVEALLISQKGIKP